jgi:hypothetical protein
MSQLHPKFGIPMAAEQYAAEWQRSASTFSAAGHYVWMNQQLGEAPQVIEIGCGAGASTVALATAGRKVLSIESNTTAADAALDKLQTAGHEAERIEVSQLASLSSWTGASVKILNIDAFAPELLSNLPRTSFDAVLCWMTGTHPEHIAQRLDIPYLDFDGGEMARYRESIQARSYEIGQACLKPKGIVQVVDRAAIRSWAQKDQMRVKLSEMQNELAGARFTTSKADCFLRKLLDGLSQSNIQYIANIPPGFDGVLVLASTKARLATGPGEA